jgi:hypothetical protein
MHPGAFTLTSSLAAQYRENVRNQRTDSATTAADSLPSRPSTGQPLHSQGALPHTRSNVAKAKLALMGLFSRPGSPNASSSVLAGRTESGRELSPRVGHSDPTLSELKCAPGQPAFAWWHCSQPASVSSP